MTARRWDLTPLPSDSGGGGGPVVAYEPTFSTLGDAPTYTREDDAGFWGPGSYGWYSEGDEFVDFGFRLVTGSAFGTFNPGTDQITVPLPVAPLPQPGPVASAWVAAATAGFASIPKRACALILDPVFSTTAALLGPDGLTNFNNSDPEVDPPPAFAVAPDYPIALTDSPLVLFVGGGRYRKAS